MAVQILQMWNGAEALLDTVDVVVASTDELVDVAKEWVGNDEELTNIELILRGTTAQGETLETRWQYELPEYDWESVSWKHEERA